MQDDIAAMYAIRDVMNRRPYTLPDGAKGVPSASRSYFTAYLLANAEMDARIHEDVASILLDVRLER